MNDEIGTTDYSPFGTTLSGAMRYVGFRIKDPNGITGGHQFQYHYGLQGRTYQGSNAYDTVLSWGGFGQNPYVIVVLFNGADSTPQVAALTGQASWITASITNNKPTITFGGYTNGAFLSARGFTYVLNS